MNLASFLNANSLLQDATFTEAVQLLESMESTPSCNRVAATRLMMSCQSIGGKADNIGSKDYVALERVRSLYAARLAICELGAARVSISAPCNSIAVEPWPRKTLFGLSTKHRPQSGIEHDFPQQALESCLKSLESRPQWWTSYSNSRQNAMVICQATRIENEKEELLNLHKSIADVTLKLRHGLGEALRMAAAESAQQKAFAHAVGAMRNKLACEIEETELRFRVVLSGIVHNIELSVGGVVNSVASALGRVHTGTTALEKVCERAFILYQLVSHRSNMY